MATINVETFSIALDKAVQFNVILPIEDQWKEDRQFKKFKTLYLLHGYYGNQNDWIQRSAIALYAKEKGVAVVMPAGENKFYVDNEKTAENYGQFVGEELVQLTRALFPLSHKREDTFIAGLSMGGYGAMRNGLKYYDTFSAIGAFSSAFIVDSLNASTEEEKDPAIRRQLSIYESTFGDLHQLKGSDKDYKALVLQLKKEEKQIPKLWITCGTEDFLINQNRDYYEFLKENHIPVTYIEEKGAHEWSYWDKAIKDFLNWI